MHSAKTLGILWLACEDVFTFQFKPISDNFTYTEQNVLKKIASLFDKLGSGNIEILQLYPAGH